MPKELLYLSIKKKILAYIKEQNLNAGDQLPSEQNLLEIFNTGRNTLRKALSILTQENLIRSAQGSGFFIAENPVFSKQFTNRLQSFASQMSAQDISINYTVLEFLQVKRPSFLDKVFLSDRELHYILRLRSGSNGQVFVYEKSWIPPSLFPTACAEDFTDSKFRYIEQHSKKIKNLNETYTPIISSPVLESIFNIPKQSPLMKSSGVLSAEDGTVLEYTEVFYNPKLYSFVSVGEP